MKKRIMTLLLAVMMVCALLPFSAAAADLSPYTELITDLAVPDDAGLLKDLNGDGTEELFMVMEDGDGPIGRVFTIENGKTKQLIEFRFNSPELTETNRFDDIEIIANGNGALVVTIEEENIDAPGEAAGYYWNNGVLTIYQLSNGALKSTDVMRYKLLMKDGTSEFNASRSTITRNGRTISGTEMNQVFSRVDDDRFDLYPMIQVYAATRGLFQDVDLDAYYAIPVQWARDKGITTGTTNVDFSPEADCTRGQVVTFLWRAAGSPDPKSTRNPFADVNSSDYFYKAVLWAVEKGITNGTSSTTFSPNQPCTRGQIATFLWRYKGSPKMTGSNPFTDVSAGEYYYDAVLWAVNEGITNGDGSANIFNPNRTCTRAMIVTFLYRSSGD